ncbi:MAG: hypothetical protein JSV03_15830 [Planctomycetota bacterium]|nr:MAG: hypothetical protein JSV03_15830 [Planctomycetota bacterium]
MSGLRSRAELTERLLVGVETAYGSGDFQVDDRLRVEEVCQRSDQTISSAIISVRIDNDFDSQEARRRYQPDRRIVVMTDETDSSDREILFEGYVPVQSSRWDGRIGREDERYVFEAEHVFERLARDREALIFGRRVRNGEIEDGLSQDPDDYTHQSVLMTALPCVFNPDGVANRADTPLTVLSPDGQSRSVHLFTWEGDRAAKKWTYATVLRYLVWFYLLKEGPVFEGNVFSVTGPVVDRVADQSDPMIKALLRQPVSFNCEATNLVEALTLLASAAGIHITAETNNDGGRPETELRVWAPEAGPLRRLYLVRGGCRTDGEPRYHTANRSTSQILSDNNIYRGHVTWDHRRIVNYPVVIGGVKQYEMTVSLWPGWVPRDNLDNVDAPDREDAKALALTPAQVEALGDDAENEDWFQRYHRRGRNFKSDADVGRLWVLNENDYYDGAIYNRNAPFDDYRPFDFSTVTDSTVTTPGAWMRRARRLLPTISTSSDGRPLGVWIEVSFDSGTTWQQQSGGVRILQDHIGIYFDCENPTEVTPAGVPPEEQNMWYAIIDQTFRVRVTASIESDERLLAVSPLDRSDSPTLQVNAMIVRRAKSFLYKSRTHTTNVLNPQGIGGSVERDDTTLIESLVRQLAHRNQDRRIRVAPTIPWLETGYALGDRIAEIRGRHLRFTTTVGAEQQYPSVVERRFVWRDDRYETILTMGITDVPGEAV